MLAVHPDWLPLTNKHQAQALLLCAAAAACHHYRLLVPAVMLGSLTQMSTLVSMG
jgi:hypothetical protein